MTNKQTSHTIHFQDARDMSRIKDNSVDLVVTSPPYPMISMWDDVFSRQNKDIKMYLKKGDGLNAYKAMHQELNKVWQEVNRVLKQGGIVCINIGDATRTLNREFKLYPNHSPIIEQFLSLGFDSLPTILWRKETNAPNKFMGSGMLPVGAYVTLEHERILIFRKKQKRVFFSSQEKENRMQSAFFYPERNKWFSDVWGDIKGTPQNIDKQGMRKRSGAYPLELPYRLINMFSVKGDTILDPFLGTGTTTAAAIITGRNSIGIEKDKEFKPLIDKQMFQAIQQAESVLQQRISRYVDFIEQRERTGKICKYKNAFYLFPVVTKQEQRICFEVPVETTQTQRQKFLVTHQFFAYK